MATRSGAGANHAAAGARFIAAIGNGLDNSYLHSFEVGDCTFGMDDTDLEELNLLNDNKFTLDAALGNSIGCSYTNMILAIAGTIGSERVNEFETKWSEYLTNFG